MKSNKWMTFNDYCKLIDDGIKKKEIMLPDGVELTELDLAIQYAVGAEQARRGTPKIEVTTDELWELIGKYCGKEVQKRIEANRGDGHEK